MSQTLTIAPEAPKTQQREGYKLTKLGWIPNEWEVTKLHKHSIKIGSGKTPKGGQSVYKLSGRPLVRSQNIGWGKLLLDEIAFIDEETHSSFPSTEIKTGDVLLNITGASIGRSAIATSKIEGGNVNQHVCIIRLNGSLNPNYFMSYLLSSLGQNQIDSFQAGGNREGLNFEQIKNLTFVLPPLPEQQKIANILSTWDKAIALTEKLIAQKQARKKGLMQVLLTGKVRFGEFVKSEKMKETKLGRIPEDWAIGTLSQSCIESGKYGINAPGTKYRPDLPKYLRITDIDEEGAFRPSEIVAVDHSESDNYFLESGDIVFARTGNTTGKTYLYDEKDGRLVFAGFLIRFQPNPEKLDVQFLKWFSETKSYWDWVKLMSSRSGQPGINSKEYGTMPLTLPPIGEQKKISFLLSVADKEIKQLKKQIEHLKSQKQGLMQKLLTAEVRVKN